MVATVIAFLGLRPAFTPYIAPPGVASLEQITLGGTPQWVLIRGRSRQNPLVLFLHGGPGMPLMYLAHSFKRGLENDFIVVQWDRRGQGKIGHAQVKYEGQASQRGGPAVDG
jgi:pimeloyl-ACP methyl ester carboxylesterase